MAEGKVLVVEDEAAWSELVEDILGSKGYQVAVVDNAEDALERVHERPPDLMIVDVNLKGVVSGLQVCQSVRRGPNPTLPILMLTCYKDESDKVAGLEAGADDYLVKPFGHEELGARVMALLRRSRGEIVAPRVLEDGGVGLDLDRHQFTLDGDAVELRPKEFALLQLFLENPEVLLGKDRIRDAVWGEGSVVTSGTLSQHVKNLRAKLGKHAARLQTVETLGYKWK